MIQESGETLAPALDFSYPKFLPQGPWAEAGTIFVFAVVAAWLSSWSLRLILKAIAGKTKTLLDDQVIEFLRGPVVKTVVLFGLAASATRLNLTEPALSGTIRSLLTLALLVWAFAFPKICGLLLGAASSQEDRFKAVGKSTLPLFDNLVKLLIFGLAVFVFISIWDVDATGWLASAGILAMAVGFAAQDTLSNLFAGVFIIADAPYRVGDFIVLDNGTRGQVTHIGLRSTRLLTRDDIEVSVPNSVMGSATITNESGGGSQRRRLRVPVGVAYGSDVDQVREVLMNVAKNEKLICSNPEPRVRFRTLGESSLDFELLCWIPEPLLRGQALDALLRSVYIELQANKIEIPFPQRDLHVKEMPR